MVTHLHGGEAEYGIHGMRTGLVSQFYAWCKVTIATPDRNGRSGEGPTCQNCVKALRKYANELRAEVDRLEAALELPAVA